MQLIIAFVLGGAAGYFLRAQVASELAAIHTKLDALIAQIKAKV